MAAPRQMATATRLFIPVMVLSVAALSACTGDSPTPSDATAAPSSSPLKTVQPHTPMQTVGLRGEPVPRHSCPLLKSRSTGAVGNPEPRVAIPEPDAFVICQEPGMAAPFIKADTLAFMEIERAASHADPKNPPDACLAYAAAPKSVVALTSEGSFQVYLPEDGCGHYQHAIRRAINSAWPEG